MKIFAIIVGLYLLFFFYIFTHAVLSVSLPPSLPPSYPPFFFVPPFLFLSISVFLPMNYALFNFLSAGGGHCRRQRRRLDCV